MRDLLALSASLLVLLASACGGDDDGGTIDPGEDASAMDASSSDGGVVSDAMSTDVSFPLDGGVCPAWQLEAVSVTALLVTETEELHTARSARVLATVELGGCDRRAVPEIVVDAESMTVNVTMRAWTPGPRFVCTEDLKILSRPLVITFPVPGSWSIVDTEGGASLDVTVAEPPTGECETLDTGDPCQRDCDCPLDERCLSGTGAGGTVQQCARPCELDMDCPTGRCVSFVDGLELVCEEGLVQCDSGNACPRGYVCDDGMCDPENPSASSTRVECECDDDCEPPHVCVMGADGSTRCEIRCLTGSEAWCGLGHFCGGPDDDVADLATSDGVCVWSGD